MIKDYHFVQAAVPVLFPVQGGICHIPRILIDFSHKNTSIFTNAG